MTVAPTGSRVRVAEQIIKRWNPWSPRFPFASMIVAAGKHRLQPILLLYRCERYSSLAAGLLPIAGV